MRLVGRPSTSCEPEKNCISFREMECWKNKRDKTSKEIDFAFGKENIFFQIWMLLNVSSRIRSASRSLQVIKGYLVVRGVKEKTLCRAKK